MKRTGVNKATKNLSVFGFTTDSWLTTNPQGDDNH